MNKIISNAEILSCSEIKNIMAGNVPESDDGDCYSGSSCEEMHAATGCYPTFDDPDSKCVGSDGCT